MAPFSENAKSTFALVGDVKGKDRQGFFSLLAKRLEDQVNGQWRR